MRWYQIKREIITDWWNDVDFPLPWRRWLYETCLADFTLACNATFLIFTWSILVSHFYLLLSHKRFDFFGFFFFKTLFFSFPVIRSVIWSVIRSVIRSVNRCVIRSVIRSGPVRSRFCRRTRGDGFHSWAITVYMLSTIVWFGFDSILFSILIVNVQTK